jgi:hypothetical protein
MTDHCIRTEDPAPYGNAPTSREPTCRWTYNEHDGVWSSACSNTFCFTDGGPHLGGFCFCPFCGRRLLIDRSEPERGDDTHASTGC